MEIKEEWRTIENYPNYMVSNMGNVKSLNYKRTGKERVLKQGIWENYCRVGLTKEGKKKTFNVHKLVATYFIPNTENKPEIDHIDGNPSNNCVSNLRWVTKIENMNNPITKNKISKTMKGRIFTQEHKDKIAKANSIALKGRKLTQEHINKHSSSLRISIVQYDLNDKLIGIWESTKQASEILGIDNSSITKCCKGKYTTCGGFKFKYLQDFLIELEKKAS